MAAHFALKGRRIARGRARGVVLRSEQPISFLGEVNPQTGVIEAEDNPLRGRSIAGSVFAFPHGRGSTVGSYVIYRLKVNGVAPVALINALAEPIVATGAIMAGLPMVDQVVLESLPQGASVEVDADVGVVTFL